MLSNQSVKYCFCKIYVKYIGIYNFKIDVNKYDYWVMYSVFFFIYICINIFKFKLSFNDRFFINLKKIYLRCYRK